MADVSKALNIVRKLSPSGFFSRATEEAQRLPQAKGTPEQMRSMLLKQGVKPDELKWTGFDDWAKGKKSVTRDEVADFLRRNEVQVGETKLGGANPYPYTTGDEWQRAINRAERQGNYDEAERLTLAWEAREGAGPGGAAKFEKYTIPGGENYRELLLRDQENSARANVIKQKYEPTLSPLIAEREALRPEYMRLYKEGPDNEFYAVKDKFFDLNQQIGRLEGRMQAEIKDLPPYRSSHWDDPNVLAHLRLSDRYDPQGRKILHVEELQSDWAQEGRKKGFVQAPGQLPQGWSTHQNSRGDWYVIDNNNTQVGVYGNTEADAIRSATTRSGQLGGVPSAPFVDSTQKWTDLALKRALAEAAGGDYAGLAVTPGRAQAKRYDLSKQIDDIRYAPSADGKTVTIEAYRGGENVLNRPNIPIENLDTFVGKDVAERIAKGVGEPDPNTGYRVLSGLDLSVGGEGMIGYYDKIVPKRLQELTRPFDPQARMSTVDVPVTTSGKPVGQMTDADLAWELNPAHSTPAATPQSVQLPFLEMTPAMREKIKEGLPLFTMMPAAVGLGASQMQEGQNPAVEERPESFDKGGVVGEGIKKAVQLSRKILGYTDPPSKKIEDWKWRPLADVAAELDVQKIPPHVQQFGDYMREMVDRAKRGEISDRDLIKAYTTTRASIQRRAADTDAVREASGLPLLGAEKKIRPEGAWSEWLMSPAGQKYLDRAVKGEMSDDTVESALSVMRKFGLAPTQIEAMDWAAKNLPGRSQTASDLIYRAGQMDSPVSDWRNFTSDVKGVGPAKSGFVASLLGRGDLPTLDARQVILNTGLPTEASQKVMARSYQGQKGFGAQEGVDRLAARQEALGLEAPAKYDPFYQHLTHHTIWDKASNEKTTHADIINAMRNAAIVLGVPAAGAAVMPEEQPVERASGGRLLEDQYPTHYLPNVGRQVMQDGGVPNNDAYLDALLAAHSDPNADIRDYQRSVAQIAQQPENVRSMTHAPSKPMRPIEIEGGFIGKRQLGEAPYDVAEPLSAAAQTAYSLKTLPFYFTPAMPLAAASDIGEAAIDTKNALQRGDYLSAAVSGGLGVGMGAFPFRKQIGSAIGNAVSTARDVLGRVPAPVAAGAAGAAAMTPEEAEAVKLRVPKGVTQILSGTPENEAMNARALEIARRATSDFNPRKLTLQEIRRTFDPEAGAGMSGDDLARLVDAYGKVASPASLDPELAMRGREIAQSYITKGGSGFGGRSYFGQKPSTPLEGLGRAAEPIPYTHEPKPIVEKSWEEVGRERAGSPLISLGGDLSDLARLRAYGPADDLRALARPSDIHAGFDYMREPNRHSVWSNNPEHAAQLEKKVLDQAVKKDLPVMAVANPMGPTSIDSAKNMMDLYLSAVEGGVIPSDALEAATKYIRSGAFGGSPKEKAKLQEKLAGFPGFEDMDKAREFLLNNPDVAGTTRAAIIKGMERKDWVKQGFPEVGQLRVAATSPKFMMAPGNVMGGRMIELDPRMFHKAEENRYFKHLTYGGDTPGTYYADVPLVHRQYGAPDVTDMLLAKYNQERPGATKSAPWKPAMTVHPFSVDPRGRDTWRKMFEEQRMVQEINDRMMNSIRRGEQNRPMYGFNLGGSVSHRAMMIAKELGSSPRETV